MRNKLLAIAAAAMLSIASTSALAQFAPGTCPNCPNGGVPKKDGTGPGYKKGKQQGPGQGQGQQKGSGPQHTPRRGGGGGGRR